ncbi:hypothetical protein GMORB2_6392 [Geosmithia morbida]|uniref:Uncharacterized protein n=1 Tax=Geosmithia morbida TaxID=1094350 RepID=A0A9P5D4M2_9HYPO|nr:uncharacterized protein GMORB2_6392 [Geosmithia morbida]KAF4123691.1 hypothetical protein GMORB2_6392 [Geosmithia morbida]
MTDRLICPVTVVVLVVLVVLVVVPDTQHPSTDTSTLP